MVASLALPADALKYAVLVLLGGGLLALGRWSSRLAATRLSDLPPADEPTPDADELRVSGPKVWPPSAEQVAASLPYDPSLGKIRIKKFYFQKSDVVPGPADPEIFADELLIELYDPDSDHAWWRSYFVATPKGLENILREKNWRYLHAPDILVLPRYDLEEIRRAAVIRIMAEAEYFKGKDQPREEEAF